MPTSRQTPETLLFADACEFLGVSTTELSLLREQGLAVYKQEQDRQVFPYQTLQLTARLLALARRQGWQAESLAWYADLAFASEVGRVVLLPLLDTNAPTQGSLPASWMETSYARALLRDLDAGEQTLAESVGPLARSLLAAAVGPGRFWASEEELRRSPLAPVLMYLGKQTQDDSLAHAAVAPAAGQLFALLVLAFSTLAPPLSRDLRRLVEATYDKLRRSAGETAIPTEEQERILREELIAIDRLYATKATEIHTPLADYAVGLGVLTAPRRTIALQLKLPIDTSEAALDNILDIIRPYLGTYGARVVQALYEIANDPPHWRSPIVTIDTNQLLDRLGEKRDGRNIHYSRNRVRLRDTLNAAHNLEIVGEYTARENGVLVRKAVRRSVLSLIGATFDASESSSLTTEELFQQGLPKTMQVRLNFYDGVRRPDGMLGDQYVLTPRLAAPSLLPPANYARTNERLRQYLLAQARQGTSEGGALTLTRETALREAGITNKNVTRATNTLEKALQVLVGNGTLVSFTQIPLRPQQTFVCILTDAALRQSLPSG